MLLRLFRPSLVRESLRLTARIQVYLSARIDWNGTSKTLPKAPPGRTVPTRQQICSPPKAGSRQFRPHFRMATFLRVRGTIACPSSSPNEREVSRSFGLKREGQIQERSLSGHRRTWIALPRLAAKWVETVILLQVICLTIATSIIAIWWNWSL